MIGPTIVFLCAVSLVATYMLTVNRLLRTDEFWSESSASKCAAQTEETALPMAGLASV